MSARLSLMWAKKLKILFVCLAGCLAVFSTVIPHHHHENGMICWVIDAAESGDTHSSDVPEKAGDCSGCSWFAYKVPVDTVSFKSISYIKVCPGKNFVGDVGYVVRFRYRQFGGISLFRYLHRAAAYIYFS